MSEFPKKNPDVSSYNPEWNFLAHQENGLVENPDENKTPESSSSIRDQLDDSEMPDAPWFNQDWNDSVHRGIEGIENPDENKTPASVGDLLGMGYSQEQIDGWVAEGLNPLEEYKHATPVGNFDPEWNFRAHEENGLEEHPDEEEKPESQDDDDSSGGDEEPPKGGEEPPTDEEPPTSENPPSDGKRPPEEDEGEPEGDEPKPAEQAFAFVSLATEEEARMAAHDIANQMFAERIAHSKNPFKRIILGNMLKEGVLARYRKQALEAIVAYNADRNDANTLYSNQTISQYWSKTGGIERFTRAYMEQIVPAIHSQAGENMRGYTTRTDENGDIYVVTRERDADGNIVERQVDANSNPGARAAIDIRRAIESYVAGTSDLASLKTQVRRIQLREGYSDERLDLSVDNLVDLAEAARDRAVHTDGIINVMEGFSYINGEAMRGVRSESRKTNIERATELISERSMGLISPEVVGAAASLALYFADKGTRSLARAVAPGLGGAIIAGATAGIRERGRVTDDVSASSRESAMGKDVSGPDGRRGKYDRQVAETLYNMQSAETLTASLNTALENNDTDAMQKALANVAALIDISDGQRIDLVRYSSGENVENERMNLDIARARVEVELKRAGIDLSRSDTYRQALNGVLAEISRDMNEKGEARAKLKNKRMLAQGAKTAATSVALGTAIREVSAYFNPNQVGILDHVFNKENNVNATNTPLVSFLGLKNEKVDPSSIVYREIQKYGGAELSNKQVEELKQQGMRVEPRTVVESQTTTQQVSVEDFAKRHGNGPIVRNWLNNDTPESNGNELRLYHSGGNGWHTGMYGNSFGGGTTRNFEQDVASGRVHAYFSLGSGTQSNPVELLTREFTAADGSTQLMFYSDNPQIQAMLDAGQGMVEVGTITDGVSQNGEQIVDVWATYLGSDVTGTVTDTFETTVSRTVYDVFATIAEGATDRLINGIAVFPFASRKALHRARRRQDTIPNSQDRNPEVAPVQ